MRNATYTARGVIIELERNKFMDNNGYKRLTAARKAEFDESIKNNEAINFYNKILGALR